jgi:hypothetical protein
MYRTYGYPVHVEWRDAFLGRRRSRRPSAVRITTAPAFAAPHKASDLLILGAFIWVP